MNDLLTNSFTEEVKLQTIQKNFRLQKWLLVIVFFYTLIDALYWIMYFSQNNTAGIKDVLEKIWFGTIFPLITLASLILNVASFLYYYHANRMILESFEKKDAGLFNNGYDFFYKSSMLTIIAYIIVLVEILFRLWIGY